MQFSKSTILPVMGIILLALLILMSYVNEAIFLDRILICSVILSFVFIAKLGENRKQ
ncbi:hypothetical protein SAMN04488008_104332 [Maribacter orientalis]|uniref:Uncharacterized protein n=1 Tax=Maribacter orientalis TaxID=228957 RepID=A0A1H7RP42_9FLAO|nr:hypothetical protein [Maribacter orientalis]SEL61157.1 hypothetical protein SAMN04488008_104332 [Maribacter orientalis]